MATTTLAKMNQSKSPSTINTVTHLLSENFNAIKSCLPKHLTPERMCRIAVQTMQTSEKSQQLLNCDAASLVHCVIESASLGLEIDSRGLAYLVPYGRKATLIFGYKGLMELAYRSGRVTNIYAETVCENDEFVFELGLQPKLEHRPNLEDRGKLRAVYAVARLKDADPVFVVLGKQDVEKIRKSSKASGSGPWVQWEEEMWKKTAIRRLCKYLPLSAEMSRAIAVDEAVEAGVRPQYLADGLINLPEENYIDVDADNKKEAKKSEPEPAPQTMSPTDEAADIFCPKKDQSVNSEDCFYCTDRDGCPEREAS